MSLRDERAQATRRIVLDSARRLFATRGYAGTSIDRIAKSGRVTKGAVYHHFSDKAAVFRAVYEELSTELESRLAAMARATDPRAALFAAVEQLLEYADDAEIRTILFRDGPAVLQGECREIDRRHYLGLIEKTLGELQTLGVLRVVDTGILASLLLALLIEGSTLLGRTDDVPATRDALRAALRHLITGLLAPTG